MPDVESDSQRTHRVEVAPQLYRVYFANNKPPYAEWIIEGTDSTLYVVRAEPGG